MTNNIYIIDSSSLIELNKHNAMDVYVSVWKNISQLIQNGRLIAPKEVLNEIQNYDDSLARWAKKLLKILKNTKTVLDVGTGTGQLMVLLKRMGYDVEGVEPNLLRKKVVEAQNLVCYDVLPQKKYDAVLVYQVLPHVPPVSFLTECFSKVNDGGVMIVEDPNMWSIRSFCDCIKTKPVFCAGSPDIILNNDGLFKIVIKRLLCFFYNKNKLCIIHKRGVGENDF